MIHPGVTLSSIPGDPAIHRPGNPPGDTRRSAWYNPATFDGRLPVKKKLSILIVLSLVIFAGCGSDETKTVETARKAPPSKLSLSAEGSMASKPAERAPESALTSDSMSANASETAESNRGASMQALIQPGETMRPFQAKDQTGDLVSLSTYKGKYVLLDFWASWCKPCHKELPFLLKLSEKYKEEEKFALIGISLDRGQKPFQEYLNKNNIGWPNILNQGQVNIAGLYGVRSIPFTVLINPEGKVIETKLRSHGMLKAVEKHLGY